MVRAPVAQAGRTTATGRWHRLEIRSAMFPWPYDHHYPEMLYPVCGSLAAGRQYFSEVGSLLIDLHCDSTVVDCKKCLKGVTCG